MTEVDYARIPRWDLPATAAAYVGDDSWGRAANPSQNNCCERPSPDSGSGLLLTPPGQGQGNQNGVGVGAGHIRTFILDIKSFNGTVDWNKTKSFVVHLAEGTNDSARTVPPRPGREHCLAGSTT
jgi:hypothetical protein